MSKSLPTVLVAVFALLCAGAAVAAPADAPAPGADPAAVQAVENAPAPAATAPAAEEGLCRAPAQGTPKGPPHFEECGDVFCPPAFYCCNPLQNLCVREGQVCIL